MKMQIVRRARSEKMFKCPPFARTHAWRCFLHWSTAVSEIGPYGN